MSNREEAAIVMNKGFYRAFTSLKQYKETTSFKKWLHNLLVQAVIQYYFDKTHHLDAIAESKIEYGYSISHNLEKSYAYGDYIKLLHQLPDACRIVFNLFVIDGYKHERIARLLHISVYTSESLLNRARNEMRSLISADN
jgi:RNA polymerase sigma-70 factor (ECF subfamily)